MKALNDYLAANSYNVEQFNFSTNRLCEEALSYLKEIIINSAELMDELSLSRCWMKTE